MHTANYNITQLGGEWEDMKKERGGRGRRQDRYEGYNASNSTSISEIAVISASVSDLNLRECLTTWMTAIQEDSIPTIG